LKKLLADAIFRNVANFICALLPSAS